MKKSSSGKKKGPAKPARRKDRKGPGKPAKKK